MKKDSKPINYKKIIIISSIILGTYILLLIFLDITTNDSGTNEKEGSYVKAEETIESLMLGNEYKVRVALGTYGVYGSFSSTSVGRVTGATCTELEKDEAERYILYCEFSYNPYKDGETDLSHESEGKLYVGYLSNGERFYYQMRSLSYDEGDGKDVLKKAICWGQTKEFGFNCQ